MKSRISEVEEHLNAMRISGIMYFIPILFYFIILFLLCRNKSKMKHCAQEKP